MVTASEFDYPEAELAGKVRELELKLAATKAKSDFLLGSTSIFGFSVQYVRLKTTAATEALLTLADQRYHWMTVFSTSGSV